MSSWTVCEIGHRRMPGQNSQRSHLILHLRAHAVWVPKYAHSPIVFWFIVVTSCVPPDSCGWFSHIFKGLSTSIRPIIWVSQGQWSNAEEYGYTWPVPNHNKAQTICHCMLLEMYCKMVQSTHGSPETTYIQISIQSEKQLLAYSECEYKYRYNRLDKIELHCSKSGVILLYTYSFIYYDSVRQQWSKSGLVGSNNLA